MEFIGGAGFLIGMLGYILALKALQRIARLEERLKETGTLDKKYGSG